MISEPLLGKRAAFLPSSENPNIENHLKNIFSCKYSQANECLWPHFWIQTIQKFPVPKLPCWKNLMQGLCPPKRSHVSWTRFIYVKEQVSCRKWKTTMFIPRKWQKYCSSCIFNFQKMTKVLLFQFLCFQFSIFYDMHHFAEVSALLMFNIMKDSFRIENNMLKVW